MLRSDILRPVKTRAQNLLDGLEFRIRRHENFVATFDNVKAKKVLLFLCRKNHVVGSAFVAGDAHETSYRNGRRDAIMEILRELNLDQSKLIAQIEEASNEDNT